MNFSRLEKLADKHMNHRKSHKERETGFVFAHGKRVMKSVILLRKMVTDDSSFDDILACAALFHDVGKGIGDHSKSGAAIARYILQDEITPRELDEVARLIEAHNERDPKGDRWDIYAKLLQDADLIDHFGIIEVWINFWYNANYDWSFEKAQEYYKDEFLKTIDSCRELINFDVTKRIYDEKIAFNKMIIERMKTEGAGEFICVK